MKSFLFFEIFLLLITGCTSKTNINTNFYCEKLNLNCIKKDRLVSFKTSKGDFDVKLYGENNPVTVNNFIKNIKKNTYKDKGFYRIISLPQVKIIYSGIYSENHQYNKKNHKLNKLGRNIPLEIKLKNEIEPKYQNQILDPSKIEKLENIFEKGSIAMVKSGKRNSSSAEFFFVTNKFPELDGRYSIFGKIVKGVEILDKLNKEDLIYEIVIFN